MVRNPLNVRGGNKAMNLCPCGYLGDSQEQCRCSGERVSNYRARISGPLLDRIDLFADVGRQRAALFRGVSCEESSTTVKARVLVARRRQIERQGLTNALVPAARLDDVAALDDASWALLENAADTLGLSARGMHRTLRVARTIADLGECGAIEPPHVAEALTFRRSARMVANG